MTAKLILFYFDIFNKKLMHLKLNLKLIPKYFYHCYKKVFNIYNIYYVLTQINRKYFWIYLLTSIFLIFIMMMHVIYLILTAFIILSQEQTFFTNIHRNIQIEIENTLPESTVNVDYLDVWVAHWWLCDRTILSTNMKKSAVQIYRYRFSEFFKGLL